MEKSKVEKTNDSSEQDNLCLFKTSSLKTRFSLSGSGSSYVPGTSVVGKHRSSKRSSKGNEEFRVLDEKGADVTPQRLTRADPDAPKSTMFFLEDGSDSETVKTDSTTLNYSFTTIFSVDNATATQNTKDSLSLETEESVSVLEMQRPLRVQREAAERSEEETKLMLRELLDINLTETETISLLDIPSSVLSEDTAGAEAQRASNRRYIDLCNSKPGNETFVERSMQTFNSAPKSKRIQTDAVVLVETGTMATNWDIHDSFQELIKTTEAAENDKAGHELCLSQTSEERRSRSYWTTDTGSSSHSSLPDIDFNGDGPHNGPDPRRVMQSKGFQHSLLIMERAALANIFQPKLAVYRGLPTLQDPYSTEDGVPEENEESPVVPTLKHMWSLSCDITKGCVVTSMSWHKKRTDMLAVGYDNSASNTGSPGLICVWSVNNPMWPERVMYCNSSVTTLDFSSSNPHLLGVGMHDGTVAIFNAAAKECVVNSVECAKKHTDQVFLVSWTKPVMEDKEEFLVSIAADGLIKKWFICAKVFNCSALMALRSDKSNGKKPAGKKKPSSILGGVVNPGLCFHFHPVDSTMYLAGTREGLIHKCVFYRQHILETYDKHFYPVNHIEWSPFSPEMFLSCSSDWTVQLWRENSPSPILGFTSSRSAVYSVRWSPKWPVVFAALKREQLEIWDLNSSILDPSVVHRAAADVEMTSLLFAKDADVVLVGDSSGGVAVYLLKNLGAGKDRQGKVVKLENII